MKKVFLLVMLFLISSATWNASAALSNKALQALTNSGTTYTYDPDAPLITEATQFSSNSSSAGDGSSFANLIDGNPETIFHSVWETAMGDVNTTAESWAALMQTNRPTETVGIGYHNLQVALNKPVSSFIFDYSGRNSDWHDNPNDILIYATNDDALAANVDASTSVSWTKIEEFTDPNIKDVVITNYSSPVIEMGASYKYIRFVIKGTTHMNTIDSRMFVKPDITGVTWNLSEFQMYEAIEVTSPKDKLEIYVDSINGLNLNYSAMLGSDPGFYSQKNYDTFIAAKSKAEQYLEESHSDAEYATVEAEYRTAYKAMVPNPVREGYYNIISANGPFATFQPNVTKAMYTEGDSLLYWGDLGQTQGRYLFHITPINNASFAIQNVASKLYIKNLIGDKDVDDTQVYLSKNPDMAQQFKFVGNGQFNIFNETIKTNYGYNVQSSHNGSGKNGTVCRWTSTANGECAWYLKEVTDQNLINTLINNGPQEILTSALNNAITKGETARNKANDYTALITKASQISSNAQSTTEASSYANLIDGNTSTIFHSVWDASFKNNVLGALGLGWHNLQFALPYAISKMRFNYTGRDDASWADSPDHITIYATNDDALGASTAAADSSSWSEITDLTDGFPGNVALSKYSSPLIDLNGSYKYLRFVVKHTTNEGKQSERTFAVPEITGVTFNLSEMQIYDDNPAASSEYNTVTGMKAACDALDAMITQARAKVTANTATQTDIDALTAAIKAVNNLYVDRDAYYAEFTALLDSSNTVYNNAMGAKQKLITSADQFSSNSSSADDVSSFANLIDDNTETIFHSHWDPAMADPSTTANSWATLQTTWITNNTSNIAVGTGYHNLQVKLTEPVNNFYFQYTGRNSDWHDNPNDIEILATNDDALGASVLASDSTQWTKITELNENLDDVALLAYTSPQIDLVNSFKYIRFVIKNTTHKNKVDSRKCVNPYITGVTWNVSEFQMYSGLNPQRVQYNYIPEMKAAVDALKKVLDDDATLTKSDFINYNIIGTLRAAKNDVLNQYADSTEFAALYKKYKIYADSSVVGSGIGFVDTQEALDAFKAALTNARSSVSLIQPTKGTLATATQTIKEAFPIFMTHVAQIVPNKWYSIISGSDYPYAQNQPIFLQSTSIGAQLKIGNYPINQINPNTDPFCIWRFVPIENKEGQYAIQNLATGQYFGPYRGQWANLSPLMDHAKTPYELQYYGNGKFKLRQVGITDELNWLKADGTSFIVLNAPANYHSNQSWKFEPVTSNTELSFNAMPDNSIQVMTLPFGLKGDHSLMSMNDIVKTYAIKSLTVTNSGTKLELKLKNDFEAGEPFIMTINDYTQYNASAPLQAILMTVPVENVDTSTIVANGLVGTLEGVTINKPGLGIFTTNSKLTATGFGNTSILGCSGYINPNLVTTQEGNTDLTIEIGDLLNGVKSVIVNKPNDKVNVYTIDGKLLKKDVKATEALNGLSKGLYIIGKKKTIVR